MRRCWVAVLALTGCEKLFSLAHVDYTPPPDAPPCEPRSVSTGRGHTCAVDWRGEVYCWGDNALGQVVPAGPGIVLQPMRVVLPSPAVQVAVGRQFNCARLESGAVWCWGYNRNGELGRARDTTDEGPFEIAGIPPSAELALGGYHACSRSADDGTIWCWGDNDEFQTGITTTEVCGDGPCARPQQIAGIAGAKAIAAGHKHTCMIDSADRVQCWGRNHREQLGVVGDDTQMPVVVPQIGAVIAIGASGKTTCAVDMSGAVTCWGENSDGQLGNGAFSGPSAPVASFVTNARSVAVGGFGACALLVDGTVSCWGSHDGGRGTFTTDATPQPAMIDRASTLASHFAHTCAIANGELLCWGSNYAGQLGRGMQSIAVSPVVVPMPVADEISAGSDHVCAITSGGLYCWGENDYAQAGTSALQRHYAPTAVATSVQLDNIATNSDQTCVWSSTGNAECWGKAWTGRLGTGTDQRSQTRMPTLATGVIDIALANDHMCVLQANDTIRCYGFNGGGRLGVNPTMQTSLTGVTVVKPAGMTGLTDLTGGGGHTCALGGGTVWCWGKNNDGQLGNGQLVDSFTPVQVGGLSPVSRVRAGEAFTCALTGTGALYCWGRNSNGQLGLGNTASVSAPQLIDVAGTTIQTFWLGRAAACAKTTGGNVYCWGDGDLGQIGNGGVVDVKVPTLIPQFAGATDIAIGETGACALVAGQTRCTGESRWLGNNDPSQSLPTAVSLGSCQ